MIEIDDTVTTWHKKTPMRYIAENGEFNYKGTETAKIVLK